MTELNERGRTAPFNFPIEDKSEKIIKVIGDGGWRRQCCAAHVGRESEGRFFFCVGIEGEWRKTIA